MASGFVRLQVKGIAEALNGIRMYKSDETASRNKLLDNAAKFLVNQLKTNVHVWEKRKSGQHMRDTIKVDFKGQYNRVIGINKPYAKYENKRRGLKNGTRHNFIDKSENAGKREIPKMVNMAYKDALRKARIPVR